MLVFSCSLFTVNMVRLPAGTPPIYIMSVTCCQTVRMSPDARSLVLVDIHEGVARLTLNNPDARNSLTAPMVEAIVAAMDTIEADESVGAVIVTGAGSAFCAGADLGNLRHATRASLTNIYEGFLRIARSPLPTIAAVNGPAVGAGMNMALGCDVRIAATRARFDTRFMQIGLHPGGGHTWMQRRIIGQQATMAAVVFSQVIDGPESERIGLSYKCVPDAELLDASHSMALGAASAPRQLVILTKQTIKDMAEIDTHDAAVTREVEPQLWTMQQPWFDERIAALQSKITTSKIKTGTS